MTAEDDVWLDSVRQLAIGQAAALHGALACLAEVPVEQRSASNPKVQQAVRLLEAGLLCAEDLVDALG